MRIRKSLGLLLPVAVVVAMGGGTPAGAVEESRWFVSFHKIDVPTIARSDVTQLIDAGTLQTDGFENLVFSFAGEFKERIPESGTIGAILIPDVEVFDYLLRNEGHFVFPLEVKFDVGGLESTIFVSPQQTAKIAFPSYRVYLYNETASGARVSLFVYRTH
jgi:hypothetical protein